MSTYTVKDIYDSSKEYKFLAESNHCLSRINTIFTKEEDTIKWINTFKPDDIFLDIGANIGIYTIYSASRVKQVYSIEPHLGNAFNLLKNVKCNNYHNIKVFSIALDNKTGFDNFYYDNMEIASSNSQLGTTTDGNNQQIKIKVSEAKFVCKLDDLFNKNVISEIPTQLKIDVDGNELLILKGASNLLSSGNIQSILVEYNLKDGNSIEEYLKDFGYQLAERQLTASGKNKIRNQNILSFAHNMLFRLKKKLRV